MSAMHTLRCSQSARIVTRHAQLPLLSHARFQSTAAASTTSTEATPASDLDSIIEVKKEIKIRTPQFNKLVGTENTPNPNSVLLDLKKLDGELDRLHESWRKLLPTTKGPIRVRTEVHNLLPENAVVLVENNKIVVGGKAIPNIWLRDNCQCSSCMHESTKQRLQDTFAIPKDLSLNSASITKKEKVHERVVDIEWSDGHKSKYSQPFLANAITSFERRSVVRQGLMNSKLWDSSIASHPPTGTFHDATDNSIGPILQKIRKYGFCYVDKTPFDTPQATEGLLHRIAFIRETHYGGFYDFTADLASQDTAYTNIALEAHTDNTYFSDPAGLQAFHLLSHTEGTGGASLLVDGFKVADELFQQDKEAYRILSTVNVHAHASGNEGISIQPYRGFPVLEHDPTTGDLLRVRWNSSDRASIELPIELVETWYDAARKFDALLKKKENEYWEQLVPGRVLIFDNWRVLHGRSSFTGKRRICGGYINRDDWMSRVKMERFGQERVLGSLASS
ncbi:Trimethyllysine dioxygenase [Macroventuria anomochaeta]|uniref:Trimethyllysine dioxygenase n=1 Tax=Macroventuria anomochaeta TaxID=301207 RepID=A0ACB6SJJ3_9PLEO|nr:Trimethyllysine dioxygenase [Macroventuria anomochaeta]KAF2633629.1 Trimethyllysine dioxygenase [Macroventuria anomochaeta]